MIRSFRSNAEQEIILTYWFIAFTVWAVAILATALVCLLLKYIDGDQETDIEVWGEAAPAKRSRKTWKRTQQGYGCINDADEDSRGYWKILGTQAHDLTWDWSQESS